MSIPPVEKLALAVRKNVRDEFESKKAGLEERLTAALGVPWTIEANPLATFAYATDGYPKESHGSMLYEYFNSAVNNIERATASKDDLNTLAPAHVLGIAVVPGLAAAYATSAIVDGTLQIQINPQSLGVNIDDAATQNKLEAALNAASSASDAAIPLAVEKGLADFYAAEPGYRAQLADILGKPVKLNPRLAENVAAFKAESARPGTKLDRDWESSFGDALNAYFKSFLFQLNAQKFKGDELLQEGFFEAVDKAEIAFRIVDQLERQSYCESVIDGGVLYLQTTFDDWYVNTEDVGKKLVDLL